MRWRWLGSHFTSHTTLLIFGLPVALNDFVTKKQKKIELNRKKLEKEKEENLFVSQTTL